MRDGLSSCETEGECRNKREEVLGPSSGKREKEEQGEVTMRKD